MRDEGEGAGKEKGDAKEEGEGEEKGMREIKMRRVQVRVRKRERQWTYFPPFYHPLGLTPVSPTAG